MSIVDHIAPLEGALVAKGFPATSEWWLRTIVRFYQSRCRQLVIRCGRRGGKSSTLCRIGVLEALYGDHKIPPGDLGIVAIVSVSRDEAAKRLRTIVAILDALGVPHKPLREGNGIELVGRPIAFQVFTASVAGVSGGTVICAICDEVSKWRDADTGANPAREVLASLRPALATMPSARIFLSSSPFGTEDAHASAFDAGDSEWQQVAFAATWTANPSVSEADTHALESDPRIHSREYAALPQAGTLGAFDAAQIAACVNVAMPSRVDSVSVPIVVADTSMGRGDAWTFGAAAFATVDRDVRTHLMGNIYDKHGKLSATDSYVMRDAAGNATPNPNYRHGRRVLLLTDMVSFTGKFAATMTADQVVANMARLAHDVGATRVIADNYGAFLLESALRRQRLTFEPIDWTGGNKSQAVIRLRQLLRERSLIVPKSTEAEALAAELGNFQEKILPSGALSFGARRGTHDDRVALLLNLCMRDVGGSFNGSPIGGRHGAYDTTPEGSGTFD